VKLMVYALCADLMVAVHVAYVAFVVVGQLLLLVGWVLGWGWIRNLWFRLAHLAAIGAVALEAVFGTTCPLTVWEHRLRRLAGQQGEDVSFVGRLLRDLIFVDVPDGVLRYCHVGFALLVIGTLVVIPPKWPGRRSGVDGPSALE
jgi:hypothetical protein